MQPTVEAVEVVDGSWFWMRVNATSSIGVRIMDTGSGVVRFPSLFAFERSEKWPSFVTKLVCLSPLTNVFAELDHFQENNLLAIFCDNLFLTFFFTKVVLLFSIF